MCQFISWIEKDGRLWYLTSTDLSSKRGKETRDYCGTPTDYPGHGAIRHFYGLKGGVNREQADFSSPANFPPQIAADIKAGKFCRWFGEIPRGLLCAQLYAEYQKQRAPLDIQFWHLFLTKINRAEARK